MAVEADLTAPGPENEAVYIRRLLRRQVDNDRRAVLGSGSFVSLLVRRFLPRQTRAFQSIRVRRLRLVVPVCVRHRRDRVDRDAVVAKLESKVPGKTHNAALGGAVVGPALRI